MSEEVKSTIIIDLSGAGGGLDKLSRDIDNATAKAKKLQDALRHNPDLDEAFGGGSSSYVPGQAQGGPNKAELDKSSRANYSRRIRESARTKKEAESTHRESYSYRYDAAKKAQRQEKNQKSKEAKTYENASRESYSARFRAAKKAKRQEQLKQDKEAKQAVKDKARHESSKRNLRQQTLNNLSGGGFANQVGRIQNYGDLATTVGEGMTGGMGTIVKMGGAMLSRLAVPIAIATETLKMVRAAAVLYHDPYMTNSDKTESFARKFVPGYGHGVDFYRDVTGESQAYGELENQTRRDQIRSQGYNQVADVSQSYKRQSVGAQSRSEAMSKYAYVGNPKSDRSKAEGADLYREELRLQPVLQKNAMNTVELTVKRKELASATLATTGATKEYNKYVAEENALRKLSMSETASQYERKQAFERLEVVGTLRNAAASRRTGAMEYEQQARQGVVGAEDQQAQGLIDVKRIHLQELQQREQESVSKAQSIGSMSLSSKLTGLIGLQMMNSGMPIEMMPENLKSGASSLANKKFNEMATKQGEKSFVWSEVGKISPMDVRDKPSDIRKEVNKAMTQLGEAEVEASKETARKMAAVINDTFLKTFTQAMAANNARNAEAITSQLQKGKIAR